MPGVFEHFAFLLKNDVFSTGLLVGVVNQYDLQRILQQLVTSRLYRRSPAVKARYRLAKLPTPPQYFLPARRETQRSFEIIRQAAMPGSSQTMFLTSKTARIIV
jgi:hypothetical protein